MPTTRGVLERALAAALLAAPPQPEDVAAAALARRLAQLIDQERGEEGETAIVVKLASEYRQVLTALGLTPAGRSARTDPRGGATVHDLPNSLEAQRNAARARRAAAGDATSA